MSTPDQPKHPHAVFRLQGIITDTFVLRLEGAYRNLKLKMWHTPLFKGDRATRKIFAGYTIGLKSGKTDYVLLTIALSFEFSEAFWEQLPPTEKGVLLPLNTALHLATIAAGTARGVFHAKLENTPYNQWCFPTVDLTQMLMGDVELNLEDGV